jgi:monofunctional biosynthetic peptidoglycan transglycosylase
MAQAPIWRTHLGRLMVLILLSGVALQLYFLLRVALMTVIDPQSTAFQRSEIWRLAIEQQRVLWSQEWRDYDRIASPLKRAVIASEDAGFNDHNGVEWDAIEKAWERNQRAEERLQRLNAQAERKGSKSSTPPPAPKVVGGSTITQQLAKNLFLGSERSLARKGQEFLVTMMLEALLSKQRILEIYLNSVEWGEGLFGAEAAARHYFSIPASQLSAAQAAHLAVMLPNPRKYEKSYSARLQAHAERIQGRMRGSEVP